MDNKQESKVIRILEAMAEQEKRKKKRKKPLLGKEKPLRYYSGWGRK